MTLTTREFLAYCLIMFSLPFILGWAINEHDERNLADREVEIGAEYAR